MTVISLETVKEGAKGEATSAATDAAATRATVGAIRATGLEVTSAMENGIGTIISGGPTPIGAVRAGSSLYNVATADDITRNSYADAMVSGAVIGSYFGPIGTAIGAGAGLLVAGVAETFDTNRWRTEGNRLQDLVDDGVEIPEEMRGAMNLTRGRSKGELVAIEQEKIKAGGRGNVEFAESRKESDLTAEDIWGSAAFFEKYGNDWLKKFSESERRDIAQKAIDSGAVREHKGTIDVDWEKAGSPEGSRTPSSSNGKAPYSGMPGRGINPNLLSALNKLAVSPTKQPNLAVAANTPLTSDYAAIQKKAGTVVSAPIPDAITALKSFQQEGGESYLKQAKISDADSIISKAGNLLAASGIYYGNIPGSTQIGINDAGKPVYGNPKLLAENNPMIGGFTVDMFKSTVAPTNVFAPEDSTKLNNIATEISSTKTVAMLDEQFRTGDKQSFVSSLLKTAKAEAPSAAEAFAAHELANNWSMISNGQKGLALGNLALQAFKFKDGTTPATKLVEVPASDTMKDTASQFTVAKAMDLSGKGVNIYAMQKNWEQIANVSGAAKFSGNIDQWAKFSQENGLLGFGKEGAAIPGVKFDDLQKKGWQDATQYGVGAIVGPKDSVIPQGYTKVADTTQGGQVIIPIPTQFTSPQLAAGVKLPNGQTISGMSDGVTSVYSGWGKKETKQLKGINGGTAMASGLAYMQKTNPEVFNTVVTDSLTRGVTAPKDKNSTSKKAFEQSKILEGNAINLSPGIKRLLAPAQLEKDSAYIASLPSISLSRLLNGSKSNDTDSLGARIGSTIAEQYTGVDETQFGGIMQSMRSLYARAGIKSKSDAYQLTNQAFAEDRINESDLLGMYKTYDMVFDSNYGVAQQILTTKRRR